MTLSFLGRCALTRARGLRRGNRRSFVRPIGQRVGIACRIGLDIGIVKVRAVRVVTNETGSPERAEMAKSEVQGVTFQPPVKKCRVTGFTYVYTRTF